MAITTYAELQTAVKNWSKRNDLDSIIPDFIRLAELRVNRNLRIRKMETRVTTNTVASQEYYGNPDVLVYASLIELNSYSANDTAIMKYTQLFNEAINAIQTEDDRDRTSGGALQVRADQFVS